MITRLPKWSEFGAFVLALIAGCINGIGLLGYEHQAVSHLSGTLTSLGTASIQFAPNAMLHLSGIMGSFFIGAGISGFVLHSHEFDLDENYSFLLLFESALLCIAIYPMVNAAYWGLYIAAMACGLQNGMVTRYSSAVIRTTHITGIMTDLGLMFGAYWRGEPLNCRKIRLFLMIIVGFFIGGMISALVFPFLTGYAFALPALLCFISAGFYRKLKARSMHQSGEPLQHKV